MELRVENGKLRMNVSAYADIFKFYRVSDTLILNSEFFSFLCQRIAKTRGKSRFFRENDKNKIYHFIFSRKCCIMIIITFRYR